MMEEDLFQEGCIGLIEAKKRYKPELNVPFQSYANFWIKKQILEAIKDYKRQKIHSNFENIDFLYQVKENYSTTDNYLPIDEINEIKELERKILEKFFIEGKSLNEISKELKIPREKVGQIKNKSLMKLKNINRKFKNHSKNLNERQVNLL